ncbi:MAG: hypothetical protein K0S32_933 [Bacteroidetes bacterium]|jgi:hypothetical protein|nr:hypothetical protein [Bacteroidota bacterium]
MNNLLKIIVLLFASIIFFGSCKTMSVTKRHYNKGFYVSRSHKMKAPEKSDNKSSATVTKEKTENAELLVTKETKASVSDEKEIVAPDNDNPFIAKKGPKKLFNSKASDFSTGGDIELSNVVKHPWKAGKMTAAKAAEDDALSLLWILIVALLIIYIVGILLDGFGLGGIIHILGVIVLVLLILWLLKLI